MIIRNNTGHDVEVLGESVPTGGETDKHVDGVNFTTTVWGENGGCLIKTNIIGEIYIKCFGQINGRLNEDGSIVLETAELC